MAIVSGAVGLAGWVLKRYGWKIAVALLTAKELSDTKDDIVRVWRANVPDADAQIEQAQRELSADPSFTLPPEVLVRLMLLNKEGPPQDVDVWTNPWDEVEDLTRRECAAWSEFDAEHC